MKALLELFMPIIFAIVVATIVYYPEGHKEIAVTARDGSVMMIPNLVYFKDRFGVCYAAPEHYDRGYSITSVDCNKVGL